MRLSIAVLGAVSVALSITSSLSATPPPLASGTSIVVFLDTSGNLPEPDPGPPADMLLFTGGRTFLASVPGCSDHPLPLQDAVLVDADGPRSSRQVKVLIDGPDAIPPGTRVKGFAPGIACLSDGIVYKKYTGTVE